MQEYFDVLNEYGYYTNEIATREECHKKGLWHKAVVLFIISNDNKKILLQQRSETKKTWPNLWDVTAGGHVLAGELGYEAIIRETKEELGIDIDLKDITFIGGTTSQDKHPEIINRHYNEYYIAHKDIDISSITLQKEEVKDIKWYTKEELLAKIHNNYQDLTGKKGVWSYIEKYFELTNKENNNE